MNRNGTNMVFYDTIMNHYGSIILSHIQRGGRALLVARNTGIGSSTSHLKSGGRSILSTHRHRVAAHYGIR